MTGKPVIEFRGVSFAYDGRVVLRDVDLSIEENDFATIVGPNGGGKTTLLKLMLGLLQPTEGTVRVLGKRPVGARRRVGYLPQRSAADRDFPARVIDVVLMGRLRGDRLFGAYTDEDTRAALAALREVDLEDSHSRPFSVLSGGQQQRVLIARALASEPRILLLDEPTSNLDAIMEKNLYDLLERLHQRMTIALVTHDVGFVTDITKTVVCVKQSVVCHETGRLTGELMSELYGRDVRAVIHDDRAGRENA
ncbi:MAG: ATP-binding cassette domain-containing protein [Candidatus Eisenbacteria bacterium]|nr:ATP-binding cassette domain-containing protein [Candidatus Eisenbacteria bacterium]